MEVSSRIELFQVNFNASNQILFKDREEQTYYFNHLPSRRVIDNCRLIPRGSYVKVAIPEPQLNSFNYLMYVNTYTIGNTVTTRKYYCYIKSHAILSSNVTQLEIDLDPFQTFIFDINFNDCFVEREHTRDDSINANIVPESLEMGTDMITAYETKYEHLSDKLVYVLCHTDSSFGSAVGKQYTGYNQEIYDSDHRTNLTERIRHFSEEGKADAIAMLYTYPRNFLSIGLNKDLATHYNGDNITSSNILRDTWTILNTQLKKSFGNYTPRNNKLYTFPFTQFQLENNAGNSIELKPQLFNNNPFSSSIAFNIDSVFGNNPTFECVPKLYSGRDLDYTSAITLQGFPLCSWNNDTYSNWFAQHSQSLGAQYTNAGNSRATANKIARNNYDTSEWNQHLGNSIFDIQQMGNAANGIGNAVGSLLSFDLGGGFKGAINDLSNYLVANSINDLQDQQAMNGYKNDLRNSKLANETTYDNAIRSQMSQINDMQVRANTCKGDTTANGLDVSRGSNTFYFKQLQIQKQYAEVIDHYFDRYGYATNRFEKVYLKTRSRFNYIKTTDCIVSGNIMMNDRLAVEGLFNSGITLWHYAPNMHMYNYNYGNNSILNSNDWR